MKHATPQRPTWHRVGCIRVMLLSDLLASLRPAHLRHAHTANPSRGRGGARSPSAAAPAPRPHAKPTKAHTPKATGRKMHHAKMSPAKAHKRAGLLWRARP